MSLWKQFEKTNCNLENKTIRIRFEKGIHKALRNDYLLLIKYLRKKYVFPYRLNIYVINKNQVKLMDGRMSWGKFHWYLSKDSYIVIPSKVEKSKLNGYTLTEEYYSILGSLIHELSHYYQMCSDLKQNDRVSEKQADYYRFKILDEWLDSLE